MQRYPAVCGHSRLRWYIQQFKQLYFQYEQLFIQQFFQFKQLFKFEQFVQQFFIIKQLLQWCSI